MNFIEWYEVEKNAQVLILDKEIEEIKKYENQKYDYIYLNGTLEYAKNPVEFLQEVKLLLKEDGKLFIAVDNKYGVKYLVGNKSQHCEKIYDSLKSNFINGTLFSKSELKEIIKKSGFMYQRYYYPLPNYEIPNVIFTDEYLPEHSNSKINYNVLYDENSLVVQDEVTLLKIMVEQNKFAEFTNSYIIELSDKEISKDVKFYGFNNLRKNKYSLVLKMKNDYVEKYPRSKEAKQHIKNINNNSRCLKELGFEVAEETNENEEKVKSKFIEWELLDKQIMKAIDNNEIDNAYEMIETWYEYIRERLNPNNQELVKNGFIDLVFENTFYNKETKQYIFFDQEWYEKNVPIKFILYRAINNLYSHNPQIREKIKEEDMFKKYDINSEEFIEKEKKIQKDIIDEEKKKIYSKQYEYRISPEELQQIIKDVKKLDKDNVELIGEINRLENKLLQYEKIIKEEKNKIDILTVEANKTIIEQIKEKLFKNRG